MLAFVLTAALVFALAQEPAPPQTPAQEVSLSMRVNRAIEKGVAWLRTRQQPDGSWPGFEGEHPGGMTALCTLTLMKSGVRRSDDGVRKGVSKVLGTEFRSVYSHSVRLMLLEALGDAESHAASAEVGLDFLVAQQVGGEWAYPWGGADMSNTQFALLGLRSAHRLGLAVPDATLVNATKDLFRLQEEKQGGFKYEVNRQPTGGMTAASLGGLRVLEELGEGRGAVTGLLRKFAKHHALADEWMVARWHPAQNAYGPNGWTPGFQYPYLWAVERWCGLTGRAKLGEHDWYAEGARWLVDEQMDNGSWQDTQENTCFALLFLRRATVSAGSSGGTTPEELAAEIDKLRPPRPIDPQWDVPRVRDWLVAGPWRSEGQNDALLKLPFDPAKVAPREGGKLLKRDWSREQLKPDGWVNLDEVLGLECDHGFVALATGVTWELDRPLEALLWLEVDDPWRVYLDGRELGHSQRISGPADGRESVPLRLERGEHTLLILVEDELGPACFGARLTGSDGKALERQPSISTTLGRAKSR
jgi:hypothetical protein